jgi:hypothetical protein
MITQRFFIEGDPADPAAWRCLGCGAQFSEAAMKHGEACAQVEGQDQVRELRQVIQAQKMELERKNRELAALHIWGDPADEIVRADMARA